jgi:hypothetical protein
MSLGNVSSTRVNGEHFRDALGYLRRATETPNYELPIHLQQYVFFWSIRFTRLMFSDILTSTARYFLVRRVNDL